MVLLSLEQYSRLTEDIEYALDQADESAELTKERLSHEHVFSKIREVDDEQ